MDHHDHHHNGGDSPLKEGVLETGQRSNDGAELRYLGPIIAALSALARKNRFQCNYPRPKSYSLFSLAAASSVLTIQMTMSGVLELPGANARPLEATL